ncbi:hypothetical protein [Oceanospirillum sediminis]|uniref:Uncharacterized protein n=1 Tax=Oceanospirillum sediminis TaxID=2760088 RepID=A0A839ILQ9_9GAMM|nr:hypothetical protein [Oceanospirillum sediminis]MBB1485821.1 hypothetical protein [Oceanospirillum sediminis]
MSLCELQTVLNQAAEASTGAHKALTSATDQLKASHDLLTAERNIALDNLAVMQAALLENRLNGATAAMKWITERLTMSGGRPDPDSPWLNDPLKYRIAHGSKPRFCPVCGSPSQGLVSDPVCSADCHRTRFLETLPEASRDAAKPLFPFCASDWTEERDLRLPFNIGEYAYATDGRLLIRRPAVEGLTELQDEHIPSAQKVRDLVSPLESRRYQKTEIRVPEQCPDCLGRGFHELITDHVAYHLDCHTCKGSGTGISDLLPVSPPALKGTYAASYVALIQDLPDLEVSEDPENHTLYFRFSGGAGILMGLEPKGMTPLVKEPPEADCYCHLQMKDGSTRYAAAIYLEPEHSQPIWRECLTDQEIVRQSIEAWRPLIGVYRK